MCFSASASFAVGGALVLLGGATLSRARNGRELPLASMPLLFSGHQTIEGLLWLELTPEMAEGSETILVHAFLLFTLVVLPVLVPTSVWLVEPPGWRRRTIAFFIAWSGAVAVTLLSMMVMHPYEATVHDGNIRYQSDFELPAIEYLYAIGVTVPLILSRHRMLIVLGVLAAALFAVTKAFFAETYVSVWCFFAAVVSVIVAAHFFRDRRARSLR